MYDENGNIVVPEEEKKLSVTKKDENGSDISEEYETPEAFINKYMPNLSLTDSSEMMKWNFDKIKDYYEQNYNDPSVNLEVKSNINYNLKTDEESFLFDSNCKDPKYLQQMLQTGQWTLQQISTTVDGGWDSVVWQGSNTISEVYDTTDDAAAEAQYTADMADIQRKDKILETRLEQVQTQEKAVEKEIDSVKSVLKNNIEQSFKTFSA